MTEPENIPDEQPPPPSTPARPVNTRMITYAAAVAALVVGSLTPWVTIFGIGLSGVSIHYGIVSLLAAGLTALLAYLSTRTMGERARRATAAVTAVAALASAGCAIYVGWAVRSSYADDASSDNEFANAFAEAFRPGLGIGVWLVLGGAVVAFLLSLPLALNKVYSLKLLAATTAGVLLLGGGAAFAADMKADSDHKKAVAAAKAKQEAEEKAEAERQAAEEAAEAARVAAEQAAEQAAEEDRRKFTVTITSCKGDEYGFSTDVKGKITNDGVNPHSYEITTRMRNRAGEQVDTATDYVSDLPPGQTAEWSGSAFGDNIAKCDSPEVEVSQY
jgi:hypothetical protein